MQRSAGMRATPPTSPPAAWPSPGVRGAAALGAPGADCTRSRPLRLVTRTVGRRQRGQGCGSESMVTESAPGLSWGGRVAGWAVRPQEGFCGEQTVHPAHPVCRRSGTPASEIHPGHAGSGRRNRPPRARSGTVAPAVDSSPACALRATWRRGARHALRRHREDTETATDLLAKPLRASFGTAGGSALPCVGMGTVVRRGPSGLPWSGSSFVGRRHEVDRGQAPAVDVTPGDPHRTGWCGQDAARPPGEPCRAPGVPGRGGAGRVGPVARRGARGERRGAGGRHARGGRDVARHADRLPDVPHLLLVLDNSEHLVDAVGELAGALLQNCRALRILATSREWLGIAGETVMPVPPLTLPDPEQPVAQQELRRSESVTLFAEPGGVRALRVHRGHHQRGHRGRDLPTPRRPPAGDRTGGGAGAGAVGEGHPRPALGPAPVVDRTAAATSPTGRRRCGRASSGATTSARTGNGCCGRGCRCSRAVSSSTPSRTCAPVTGSPSTTC